MTEERTRTPKKWKLLLTNWLFIYPCVNILFALLFPYMAEQHQLVKTLVLTAILVPLMGFCLPIIHKKLENWLKS